MKKFALLTALAATFAGGAVLAPHAMAANARHPYRNVNKANDKGNSTGDMTTEKLNQMQLDQARAGK